MTKTGRKTPMTVQKNKGNIQYKQNRAYGTNPGGPVLSVCFFKKEKGAAHQQLLLLGTNNSPYLDV